MKQITTLIISILLISCNSTSDSDKKLKNYMQGLKVLETHDSNGVIDYAKAIEYFDKSIQENPNHIESKYWKMQSEVKLCKLDNALETAKSVINDSNMINQILINHFYVTAGLVEKIKGNPNKSLEYFSIAIENYSSLIKKNTNNTDAIMNKAIILCYMDKKENAINFIDSISLNDEKQITLEQIRNNIIDFDTEKFMNEYKGDKN